MKKTAQPIQEFEINGIEISVHQCEKTGPRGRFIAWDKNTLAVNINHPGILVNGRDPLCLLSCRYTVDNFGDMDEGEWDSFVGDFALLGDTLANIKKAPESEALRMRAGQMMRFVHSL